MTAEMHTKVLVVDDEEGIRTLLRIFLSRKGFEVLTAENGNEGIEVFKRERPPIVITDIKMPGMDGLELLRQIRDLDPDTRVIVITGHGDMTSVIESLRLEVSDFICKPVKEEALLTAIRRAQEILWMKDRRRKYTHNLEKMIEETMGELKKTNDFQENLIESSIDGIIGIDKDGTVRIFYRAAEELTGHKSQAVVGRLNITQIYSSPGLAREIKKKIYSADYGGAGRLRDLKVNVLNKVGEEIPIRLSATLLFRDNKEIGSVGFFQDLREIKQLQAELLEKERLSAVGETITGMGHYIKNILNGLEGGAYMVNTGLKKNKEHLLTKGWEIVQKNVSKISDLVLNMLTYSREHKPEHEQCVCSPNDIAKDVCDLMKERAKKNDIELFQDFDPMLPQCYLFPEGIHRSLLNLVTNAIDACMDQEGEGKNLSVVVRTRKVEDGIRFDIIDNGAGMKKEVQAELFSRFFSTKGSKGSGFGLLVTRKIIEEHGGAITFVSEPGEGSTFTVHLPLKQA
ncbi:MAG: response regulator [Deltaproteobacteria bacterium]|nr:response regulator [Deltaproteobacteria bacterium]